MNRLTNETISTLFIPTWFSANNQKPMCASRIWKICRISTFYQVKIKLNLPKKKIASPGHQTEKQPFWRITSSVTILRVKDWATDQLDVLFDHLCCFRVTWREFKFMARWQTCTYNYILILLGRTPGQSIRN